MKKCLAFILALALCLSTVMMFGCGDADVTQTTTASSQTETTAATTPKETTAESTTAATTEATTETTEATTETTETTESTPAVCTHNFEKTETIPAGYAQDEEIHYTCSLCGTTKIEIGEKGIRSIKILAIGNSFSVDAMTYLWDVFHIAGFEEIVLGNLYIGGCDLDTHWSNMQSGAASYTYYKNTTGIQETIEKQDLASVLKSDTWDFITVQQSSPNSGLASTYGNLQNITDYITKNKTNPNAKLFWHMTWAYQKNSTQTGFSNYQSSQQVMYDSIIQTTQDVVLKNSNIDGVIPCGTTIQNLRTSYLGDAFTRDSYHLSYDLGRFSAAVTWFATLTGLSAEKITDVPNSNYMKICQNVAVIKEAADAAVANPYTITTCTRTAGEVITKYLEMTDADREILTNAGYNPDDFLVLDTATALHSFYNSSANATLNSMDTGSAAIAVKFASSRMFEKAEIPNGSVIYMAEGFHYRPEGWEALNKTGKRPDFVEDTIVLVDDAWWGNYNFRAFTIAHVVAKNNMELSQLDVLKIYVPKS